MIHFDGTLRRNDLALRAEDLRIGPGITVLVGPNAAGKSSFARLLAGLLAVDSGRLSLNGSVVDDRTDKIWVPAHHRPVAMAFQDHRLFEHLSVVENVGFGLRAQASNESQRTTKANAALDAVGFDGDRTSPPRRLSGGQRQRVGLARALVVDAPILILDEPLASIDEKSRQPLREMISNQAATTTLLITHDPDDVDALADHVLTIEAGTITASGPKGLDGSAAAQSL